MKVATFFQWKKQSDVSVQTKHKEEISKPVQVSKHITLKGQFIQKIYFLTYPISIKIVLFIQILRNPSVETVSAFFFLAHFMRFYVFSLGLSID